MRECLEEIGARVSVGELRFVRDYIARNHEFSVGNPGFHGLELIFECHLLPGQEPRLGALPDNLQTGVRWVPRKTLTVAPLYPKILRRLLVGDAPSPVYLGDVN